MAMENRCLTQTHPSGESAKTMLSLVFIGLVAIFFGRSFHEPTSLYPNSMLVYRGDDAD